jgi:hypothetical protein
MKRPRALKENILVWLACGSAPQQARGSLRSKTRRDRGASRVSKAKRLAQAALIYECVINLKPSHMNLMRPARQGPMMERRRSSLHLTPKGSPSGFHDSLLCRCPAYVGKSPKLEVIPLFECTIIVVLTRWKWTVSFTRKKERKRCLKHRSYSGEDSLCHPEILDRGSKNKNQNLNLELNKMSCGMMR